MVVQEFTTSCPKCDGAVTHTHTEGVSYEAHCHRCGAAWPVELDKGVKMISMPYLSSLASQIPSWEQTVTVLVH